MLYVNRLNNHVKTNVDDEGRRIMGMLKAQLVRSGAQIKGSGELINACLVLFV